MSLAHIQSHSQMQPGFGCAAVREANASEHLGEDQDKCDPILDHIYVPSPPTGRSSKVSGIVASDWTSLKLSNDGLRRSVGPDGHTPWCMHVYRHMDYMIERINQALTDPGSMLYTDAELEDPIPDPFPEPVRPKAARELLKSFMREAPNAGGAMASHDYFGDGEDAASAVREIRERIHAERNDN